MKDLDVKNRCCKKFFQTFYFKFEDFVRYCAILIKKFVVFRGLYRKVMFRILMF